MRRDWSSARMAHMSRPCRVCGRGAYGNVWAHYAPLELAHLLGRAHDEIRRGPRGGKVAFVHPQSVVVLCGEHHREFDAHDLDLWPYLSLEEQNWCIDQVGLGEARRRVSGRKWLEEAA